MLPTTPCWIILLTSNLAEKYIKCETEIILAISDGMTINWSSHLNCDVFAPIQLSSPGDTQQPKFGRWEGGGKKKRSRGKKVP